MSDHTPLVHVNVRIPREALNFFKQYPNYSRAIRTALQEYIQREKQKSVTND